MSAYTGDTYYGTPAVKPATFQWHVPAYLFVSGLAGGAQVIAAIADVCAPLRMGGVVRNGRAIAFAGAVAGPLLLVRDLKTPRRWYNMFRIFRRTSPMSIGTYVLTAFGATGALAGLLEWLSGPRRPRAAVPLVDVPAAAAGAGLLVYTGALLSSTSTPLWVAQSPLLGARLGAGGIASAATALSLAQACSGDVESIAPLEKLAATATIGYAALTHRARVQTYDARVEEPIEKPPYGMLDKLGNALSVAVPLGCYALKMIAARRSRFLSIAAAVSALAGAALTRYAEVEAGKASAKRPADYLRYASAEEPERR